MLSQIEISKHWHERAGLHGIGPDTKWNVEDVIDYQFNQEMHKDACL